ncbi:hypothetical protein HELRODRAFT_79127, partial [Helobdella robusta]|uniref:Reticulon-like protein n=1 Tax=Helobdella robusta TaxID=6412 RepID=T1G3K5_HELRO
YLDLDIGLSEENVHRVTKSVVSHGVAFIAELRRLLLIEDIVDSIKFGLFLWVLTYIGAWFNGMTLIIIGLFFIF